MKRQILNSNSQRSLLMGVSGGIASFVLGQPIASGEVVESDNSVATVHAEVTQLAASGYAVVGPQVVKSFSGETLVLFPVGREVTFQLKGKNLIVKDQQLNEISASAIVPGARVYVCAQKTATPDSSELNVIVIVLKPVSHSFHH